MGWLLVLWQGVTAVGGGLALLFIVTLSISIVALVVLYVGSAIAVLERFARVARSPLWLVVFAAATALVAALVGQQSSMPELASQPLAASLAALPRHLAMAAGATAIAIALLMFALHVLSSAQMANLALAAAALLLAPVLGAHGGLPAAAAPCLLAAAIAVVLALRRRRRGTHVGPDAQVGLNERRARWAALLLASGLGVAQLPQLRAERVAEVSGSGLAALLVFLTLGLVPIAAAGFMGMRGSAEWFIALRYLVAKRRQVFISAITGICVVGIAAGVWLIIVVLSVMNGFERTWRDEILGNRAHFSVHSRRGPIEDYDEVVARVRATPGVVGASPFIDADGMVRGEGGQIYSVRVRGIDPAHVADVTNLNDDMVIGSVEDLLPGSDEGGEAERSDFPILIGNQLAGALGVTIGDRMLVISPFGGPPTPLGPAPRLERFRVAGVYRSSFYQYDEVYTYVTLEAAQNFRRAGPVIDGIEGLTHDFYRSRQVGRAVVDALDYPYYTRDWKEYFPAFFQALKTERVMMFLLLTMIMVVAAFVIVATLIMMIMEKSSDIAILKAMGAEDALIERIFALEGTLIGLVGTALGVVAGIAVTHRLSWIQDRIEGLTGVDTLPASVYQFSTLPSQVDPLQVAFVIAIAMVLSLGATLLPSRQGARLDPAEGLRHE